MTDLPQAAIEAAARIVDEMAFVTPHERSKAELILRRVNARQKAYKILTAALPHLTGWLDVVESMATVDQVARALERDHPFLDENCIAAEVVDMAATACKEVKLALMYPAPPEK